MSSDSPNKGLEIERKFLVAKVPPFLILGYDHDHIRQGYLAINDDGSEARVRDRNGTYTLAIKTGRGLVRSECEITINDQLFENLWPSTQDKRIEKRRLSFPYLDRTVELDFYEGSLKGLRIAEIEFPAVTAANSFEVPEWLGQDVTSDSRYKNASLATNGLPVDAT